MLLATISWAGAQTLGSALESIESRTRDVAARYQSGSTWGVQTAADDLNRLVAESARLSAALAGDDARGVEQLQRGFSTAARRVDTSRVLLPEAEQTEIQQVLGEVALVDERLTQLRLRFGSQANIVPGALAEMPLAPANVDGDYSNIHELLIDVRSARYLASTLGNRRFPAYGLLGGTLSNLDPLHVRRVVHAGWALERELSVQLDDVSQSLPEWTTFKREYDRLMYLGTGSNVRQLERVMDRLNCFYSIEETESADTTGLE